MSSQSSDNIDWRVQTVTVSGRYEGELPIGNHYERNHLELRIDIDHSDPDIPVMNKISGDQFLGRLYAFYRYSWIVNNPIITWAPYQVNISGDVDFWEQGHPHTQMELVVPWQPYRPPSVAYIRFNENGNWGLWYTCLKKSDCFRSVNLEIDITTSVNVEPILPKYNTQGHPILERPSDISFRELTIAKAYREAGVCISIRPGPTIIDDSAIISRGWTDAELHDAMEMHFSQFGESPKWELWGLLCGYMHEREDLAGEMFDWSALGRPPERQGFAIFRDAWKNPPPPDGDGSDKLTVVSQNNQNQDQVYNMRDYLFAWIHEIGHAFNLVHSEDKGPPPFRYSWMTANHFWLGFFENFKFKFEDDELIHIRHGNRSSVIMGGDPYGSGRNLEPSLHGAMSQLERGEPPVELLLRSKDHFEYMEPIEIEIRIRNLGTDQIKLDTRLNPEFGVITIYIILPNGGIVKYSPVIKKLGIKSFQILKPLASNIEGEDRYSENIDITFGKSGFYFSNPGQYFIRAFYRLDNNQLALSNVLPIHVLYPSTKEESLLASKFFNFEAGMSLYLKGSKSPFLTSGRKRYLSQCHKNIMTPY